MRQRDGIRPAADVSPFYWDVPKQGFKWTDPPDHNASPAGRLLVPEGGPVRRYIPLCDVPTLFRLFAGTEPSESGILSFANRYGMLGVARVVMFRSEMMLESNEGIFALDRVGFGEDMLVWKEEIMALAEAVDLWDATRIGDSLHLKRTLGRGATLAADCEFLRRVDVPTTCGPWPDVAADIQVSPHAAAFAIGRDCERSPSRAELHRLASFWLEQRVNERLARLTKSCLMSEQGRPALRIVPRTLLGALWLQLALAVDGGKQYRKCRFCTGWFAIGFDRHEYTRAKQFCSDRCRVKANRWKQSDKRFARTTP